MGVSCIILAGGKIRGMKNEKALVLLDKKALIAYSLFVAKNFFSDIVVVVKNREEREKVIEEVRKYSKNVKVIADNKRVFSPVAGIKEGIKHIKNDYFFLLACDMPFVQDRTIRELLPRTKEMVDCILYFWGLNKYETLCGIYKKKIFENCGPKKDLNEIIEKSKNKVFVPISMPTNEFFDIDTKDDLERANKILKEFEILNMQNYYKNQI
ncbi:MAG: molybdenum cofactor guanylyltransferase [Candidatus Aenigmatarchaeota archaeon]